MLIQFQFKISNRFISKRKTSSSPDCRQGRRQVGERRGRSPQILDGNSYNFEQNLPLTCKVKLMRVGKSRPLPNYLYGYEPHCRSTTNHLSLPDARPWVWSFLQWINPKWSLQVMAHAVGHGKPARWNKMTIFAQYNLDAEPEKGPPAPPGQGRPRQKGGLQIWLGTFVTAYRDTRTELTKNWFHTFPLSIFIFI